MSTRTRSPLVAAAALVLFACSATTATELPSGDGNVAGGGGPATTATSSPPPESNDAGSQSPPSTPTSNPDSGLPPPSTWPDSGTQPVADSGPGYFIDTGTAHDAGAPPVQGALGSCSNPACATDGTECGCQAIDSLGEQILMGCQAGGQCICLTNMQPQDNPFDENGACTDSPSTQQQFLQFCNCN